MKKDETGNWLGNGEGEGNLTSGERGHEKPKPGTVAWGEGVTWWMYVFWGALTFLPV